MSLHMRLAIFLSFTILAANPALAQSERADLTADAPYFDKLAPKSEQPVFAVCSKQGMRILVSRDDGKTWRQTFLATEEKEDGGWHGSFAVYGMAYTDGVIGAFAGWGAKPSYLGSVDGEKWGYLHAQGAAPGRTYPWDAGAGKGVMLTTGSSFQPMARATSFTEWKLIPVAKLLEGGKTHHMIVGYGDFAKGAFVTVGDGNHVLYSHDLGETWAHTTIPAEAGKGQDAVVFGNGVFVCSFPNVVARSVDGGRTWTLHPHGLTGRLAWRGLSFVKGEFWLTGKGGKGARRSKDGITWSDLPAGTPGGKFIEAETGTLINIERDRHDIRRSTDGGRDVADRLRGADQRRDMEPRARRVWEGEPAVGSCTAVMLLRFAHGPDELQRIADRSEHLSLERRGNSHPTLRL